MKSTEELTKEVLDKIEKKKKSRARWYSYFKGVAAVILIAGVFVPVAIHFTLNNEGAPFAPLAKPYDQEESSPIDSEETSDVHETFFGNYEDFTTNLSV